jgi:hypothetical protein
MLAERGTVIRGARGRVRRTIQMLAERETDMDRRRTKLNTIAIAGDDSCVALTEDSDTLVSVSELVDIAVQDA